jgi:RNA polymerase sigma-B factor
VLDGDPNHDAGIARHERELLRKVHENGDRSARDELAERMLPLARALANRYAGRGEPLEDLIQVASIGVMKSIDGFDMSRQVRLSSYATPTVLGELRRHFRDRTWSVRVPRGLQELQMRVARCRDELTRDHGRSPTVQEIADVLDESFEDVLATIESAGARRARSLEEPVGHDLTLADAIGASDPELERAEMRAVLADAFAVLTPRDREVIRLRFEEDMTQTEIAERVGVSQMQVSRLIRQSLARLRIDIEARPPRPPRPGRPA